ncbi:calcium ATPase [Piromyces finnis]|uniref:Calcium ATPase n=1 Tax=Piromyces finnis TaxID=1754191 RepID=A0A1Y1UFK2_9FUNG|nr:calcium ATPase [Piromyces finnis]|eukprot:ORX35845.1 calcium ATPase [Piromyces finnis]
MSSKDVIIEPKEEEEKVEYHLLSIDETKSLLHTDVTTGLTQDEATERLQRVGANELYVTYSNSMNIVLLIALIVSCCVQDWVEAIVLAVVIVTNTGIGFFQEFKSEKTMEALKKMSSPTARVLRNHEVNVIPCREVVPGDVVYLEEGDVIPADLRLCEAVNLEIDESLLTGESVPAVKQVNKLEVKENEISVGDRTNCAFKNSLATKGRGIGIVIGTGLKTEVGKIAVMLEKSESKSQSGKTPLQKTMDRMMFLLLGIAIILAVVVFAVNKFKITSEVLLYAISLAVAILPEGLPAVVTVTMAVGVRHMAKEKAIIRRLAALEALGQVTDICSDKTGTLTQSKMVVKSCYIGEEDFEVTGVGIIPEGKLMRKAPDSKKYTEEVPLSEINQDSQRLDLASMVCALCSTSSLFYEKEENAWKSIGDPTEIALVVFAQKFGYTKEKISEKYEFIMEHPFDAVVKRMTVIYKNKETGKYLFLSKGAMESELSICNNYMTKDNQIEQIHPDVGKKSKKFMMKFASRGMRVLGLSYAFRDTYDENMTREQAESDLIYLGIIGMYDPPREESAASVRMCQEAGIIVRMATGDHPATAKAIAAEIGIISKENMNKKNPEDVDAMTYLPLVIARCTPQTKVTLIEALHRRREKFVAMTGDGVNDAPAIKMADIGIAMGKGGSDVTKQASSITLTDDNFAILGLFFKDQNVSVFPMSPAQILYLNMVTSSPIALALGVEKAAKDVMHHPPRPLSSSLFSFELMLDTVIYGLLMGVLSLVSYIITIIAKNGSDLLTNNVNCNESDGIEEEKFHGFNCRHNRKSGFFTKQKMNKALLFSFILGLILIVPTAYIPVINDKVFKQTYITWQWALIGFSILSLLHSLKYTKLLNVVSGVLTWL